MTSIAKLLLEPISQYTKPGYRIYSGNVACSFIYLGLFFGRETGLGEQ